VLPALEDGQFLILVRKRTNYFVQFASSGRAGLRAEAVSNAYLKGKARLAAKQVAALQRMGWNNVSRDEKEAGAGGSPNFFRDWDRDVDPALAADFAVATLRKVYGVRRPGELEYWASAHTGGEIILPTLGIPQDRKAKKRESAGAEAPLPFARISSPEQLTGEVSRALAAMVEKETFEPDEDGEFSLRTGRSVVYIRVRDDEPAVRIYSFVASGVRRGPALLETINDFNGKYNYVRFGAGDDFVVVALDLHCATFVRRGLLAAVACLCDVADQVNKELEGRFGADVAPHPGDALAEANHSAGRATAAWLTGQGLASAAEKLRTEEGEAPIPAPLIEQWRQKLLESTTVAVQSADAVLSQVNGEVKLKPEDLVALVGRGAEQAAEAERCCRALARLALGITSHTNWCEETARLERAAVLVLADSGVKVEDEEVVFFGRDRSELVSEAAGLLCWMLTQQSCERVIGNPQAGRSALKIAVDDRSNLLIRQNGDEQAWEAPVTVLEPARYIADFLVEQGWATPDA